MKDGKGFELSNAGLKGACEVGTGWKSVGGAPRVELCGEAGEWRPMGVMPYGMIACERHYQAHLGWEEKKP